MVGLWDLVSCARTIQQLLILLILHLQNHRHRANEGHIAMDRVLNTYVERIYIYIYIGPTRKVKSSVAAR